MPRPIDMENGQTLAPWWQSRCDNHRLYRGDCAEVLKRLPSRAYDCVVTDPPYPCIKRDYGYWTEEAWFAMMRVVVPECMRIIKPYGSCVFILQPNSLRLGRMRTWLWEFMSWVGHEWGIVQDVWWWNVNAIPEAHSIQGKLTRPSLKACVWIGPNQCYRVQSNILWGESIRNATNRAVQRFERKERPSGHRFYRPGDAAAIRGGVTPFNVLPMSNGGSYDTGGKHGHGAGTPLQLCQWWLSYICPTGGKVLDPFMGSGTMGLAAIKEGAQCHGIERHEPYLRIAKKRLQAALSEPVIAQPEGRDELGLFS